MVQLIKRLLILYMLNEHVSVEADYSNRDLQLSVLNLNIGMETRELLVSREELLFAKISNFFRYVSICRLNQIRKCIVLCSLLNSLPEH